MGGTKHDLFDDTEDGLNLAVARDKFVCPACFQDEFLRDVARAAAESRECTFCGKKAKGAIAAPLVILVEHINACLSRHYEDAAGALPYESAEGGYQGETFDTTDVLEAIEMEASLTEPNDTLLDTIRDALGDRTWCELNPFALREHEQLSLSWERFAEFIKHERRFFFLQKVEKSAGDYSERLLDAAEILHFIVGRSIDLGLVRTLGAGAQLYRVRRQEAGRPLRSALDLGPPPRALASQANRMSPPGIVMTYVSEDSLTALAETAPAPSVPHLYRVAEFALARDVTILDLTRVPPVPGIFNLDGAVERDAIIFLQAFADDISKPIARDDRTHVEYVPTQVITEYVRVSPALRKLGVEGVRYASARRRRGVSLVLFGGRELLELTGEERAGLVTEETVAVPIGGPMLRLTRSFGRTFPKTARGGS